MRKAKTTNYRVMAETITPVHIGSGRELQYNTDYLYFADKRQIAVIDPNKALEIIGTENINAWVTSINQRKGLDEYITKILKKPMQPADISSRLIQMETRGLSRQAIKEQLHNGAGVPYIPGSSIKGALRTAILTTLIEKEPEFVVNLHNLKKAVKRKGQINYEFDDGKLIANYFGIDPNQDFLRFLRVGDAHFDNTSCYLIITENLTPNGWQIKEQINQYVECISYGQSATFNLSIFDSGDLGKNYIHKNIELILDGDFFKLINTYTLRWINNEIAFWDNKGDGQTEKEYLKVLINLEKIAKDLPSDSCMVRVGFGGGFTSMTGDWQTDYMTEDDYGELVYSLRHPKYEGLLFPKTRKFTQDSLQLGFIKFSAQKV